MRRILAGLLAFLTLTATLLVLPVYAAPTPEPEPVTTSSDEVPMGSVEEPAPDADVQDGTTDPVAGVPPTAPALTVREDDVAPFSLVGVTWAYDPGVTDTVVQVRVRTEDGGWGSWTEVATEGPEQSPAADTGAELRGGTSPLWTGPSTGVEVELVTRSGAQPTDVVLDLVDPGESAADASLDDPEITDTANAAATMPPVFSRAQWGADEGIRTWAPEYAATLKAATLHHTADSNAYTADQVPAIMRSIYRYHAVSLGWGDIGYNVIVDKFGRLYEGRAGGLAKAVIGAHAGGFNTGTFGVSMLGNHETAPVAQVTVDSVAAIIAWKFSLFGVNPTGTTVLTGGGSTSRYAAGSKVTLPTIFGHIDVKATACPGKYGYARLGEIRNQVAARMASAVSPIQSRYTSDAGIRSVLGAPSGGEQSSNGVTWQVYANGRMYWSPATGARALWGDILGRYLALGGPAALGAPVTDHLPTGGNTGYHATFQNGSIFWSLSTGAKWVRGWVYDRWSVHTREHGFLGYPTGEEVAVAGGSTQSFQGGVISSSPSTGAREVHGWVLDKWTSLGREKGFLGFPTSDEVGTPSGVYNTFAGGAIWSTPATGAHEVHGWISARWMALGSARSFVGFPVSDERPAGDGVGAFSEFSNGLIYYSPATGAHDIVGPAAAKWRSMGGVRSFLGYPTADARPLPGGGWLNSFQGGSILFSATSGAFEVHGWIGDLWARKSGVLGYPTSDEQRAPDGVGVFQTFQGGVVYSSPSTGAHEVHGLIREKWSALGGFSFPGAPVTDELTMPDGVGRANVFSSGAAIYFSPGTGAWEVHGWVRDLYSSLNGEQSFLGYPVSDETPLPGGGVLARFQGGHIYSSGATGAREVHGAILARYLELGGPSSSLGLPVSNEYSVPGGRRSDFQGGSIICNTRTGVLTVTSR